MNTASHNPRRMLTVPHACEYAGIKRSTLYNEAAAGRLTLLKIGRRTVAEISELDRWLDARTKPLHEPIADTAA